MKRFLLVAMAALLVGITTIEVFAQVAEFSGPTPVEGRRRRDRVNPPLPPLPEPQPQPRPQPDNRPRPKPEPDSNFDRVRPLPRPNVNPLPLPDLDDVIPDVVKPGWVAKIFTFVGRVIWWALFAFVAVGIVFVLPFYLQARSLVDWINSLRK